MNFPSIIVLLLLALIVAAIVFHGIRSKKKGNCACSGSCPGGCGGCATAHNQKCHQQHDKV